MQISVNSTAVCSHYGRNSLHSKCFWNSMVRESVLNSFLCDGTTVGTMISWMPWKGNFQYQNHRLVCVKFFFRIYFYNFMSLNSLTNCIIVESLQSELCCNKAVNYKKYSCIPQYWIIRPQEDTWNRTIVLLQCTHNTCTSMQTVYPLCLLFNMKQVLMKPHITNIFFIIYPEIHYNRFY